MVVVPAPLAPLAVAEPINKMSPVIACACWQKRPQLSRPIASTVSVLVRFFIVFFFLRLIRKPLTSLKFPAQSFHSHERDAKQSNRGAAIRHRAEGAGCGTRQREPEA